VFSRLHCERAVLGKDYARAALDSDIQQPYGHRSFLLLSLCPVVASPFPLHLCFHDSVSHLLFLLLNNCQRPRNAISPPYPTALLFINLLVPNCRRFTLACFHPLGLSFTPIPIYSSTTLLSCSILASASLRRHQEQAIGLYSRLTIARIFLYSSIFTS